MKTRVAERKPQEWFKQSLRLIVQVIAQLKSSCESLSEESLAKLGVELFNCQAQIEGRRTFPCSEEMVRTSS